MSEWWTYRLEDFLLFSPRVYWRMFELHNAAFWPLHLLTLASGLAIVLLMLRRPRRHGLWIALILAALFASVGWSFLWSRYAVINWAIAYVAPAFGLQALLLAIGGAHGGLAFDRRDIAGRFGLLLIAVGLVVYPLLPPLFGRPWASAEIFGIAPDPTAIATLGVLLAASGPVPLLFPIPLLWLLLSGLTLHAMGDPQAWLPLLAAATTVAALAMRRIAR
ncbi:DUF6064 family protein [Mesorhizobium sp. M0938]|uniref:DUF6064 family protein n=1 Tax=unclassified Mesorhizobium TaxID=325217 RepID=UPI0033380F9D